MRRFLWLVLGLGLIVFGTYLVIVLDGSVDFGWYAFEPGEEERAVGDSVTVLTPTQVLGAGAAVAGIAVLAAEIGYRMGLRRR